MRELIIFDLDGVLLSASWKGLFETYKIIIGREGKDYRNFFRNLEEFKKWWSPDWRSNIQKVAVSNEDNCNEIFYEHYNKCVRVFGWVPSVLEKLSLKYRLAIFTNRHRSNAEQFLPPVAHYFSMVVGGEDVVKLKPAPEGILMILDRLGVQKENAIMIGDQPQDIMSGKSAGVKTGIVSWGLGDVTELSKTNPDYIFRSPRNLLLL